MKWAMKHFADCFIFEAISHASLVPLFNEIVKWAKDNDYRLVPENSFIYRVERKDYDIQIFMAYTPSRLTYSQSEGNFRQDTEYDVYDISVMFMNASVAAHFKLEFASE